MLHERRRESAFTLLEMMIALSIAVVVLGVVYGTYAASTGSLRSSKAAIEQDRVALAALRRMTQDIRCARQPERTLQLRPRDVQVTAIDDQPPAFFAAEPHSQETFLRIYTTAAVLGPDATPAGLYIVEYSFDTVARQLLRRQSSALARTAAILQQDTSGRNTEWRPVAENVEDILVRYSDGKADRTSWNSNEMQALPATVNITLTLRNEHGSREYSATAKK